MSMSVSLSRLSFRPQNAFKLGKKVEVLTKSSGDFNQKDLLWKAANLGPPEWVSEEWVHDRLILRPALCDDAKTPDKQVYILVKNIAAFNS